MEADEALETALSPSEKRSLRQRKKVAVEQLQEEFAEESSRQFDAVPPPPPVKRKKKWQCNVVNGFWICGIKCCPAIVVEWIPLCLLLSAFMILFLAGLLIAFFLTSASFAILAQENAWEMDSWQYPDRPMINTRSNNVFEEGKSVVIDVQFPMSTYIPSLVGLTVIHYGVSVRFLPLYDSSTSVSARSTCVLNAILADTPSLLSQCDRSLNEGNSTDDAKSSGRSWLSSFGGTSSHLTSSSSLVSSAHKEIIKEQIKVMLKEAKYFVNETLLQPFIKSPSQVFPSVSRLAVRAHQVPRQRDFTGTDKKSVPQYLWPKQVHTRLEDAHTNFQSLDAHVEVSWEANARETSQAKLSSEALGRSASTPEILLLRDIWKKQSVLNISELQPIKTDVPIETYLPRWRRNTSRDFLSKSEPSLSNRQVILNARKHARRNWPREVKLSFSPTATQDEISWWVTSLMLTKLDACKDDAIQTMEWLTVLESYGGVEGLSRFGETCGELWLAVLTRLKELKNEESRTAVLQALAEASTDDVSVSFVLPPKMRMVRDPLISRHLPKGSAGPFQFGLYQDVLIETNAAFCAALRRDCQSWSFALFELQFEGVYPCLWCSFLFRPHSYHYPFVIPCDVANVKC